MVLTRAQNQPGPDGKLGTADDVQDANNTDSPWVDQSQTYTSHSSHQAFLREYALDANNRPFSTGKFLDGIEQDETWPLPDGTVCYNDGNATTGSMATWAATKQQAAQKLGLLLVDKDVTNIPMLATDPYGNFLPGPARGLPQYVTDTGLVEGNLAHPVAVPANVVHFDTPFLTDIAHNADPAPRPTPTTTRRRRHRWPRRRTRTTPRRPTSPSSRPERTTTRCSTTHFTCGDGRCNENIALSTIHQVFHSEHNRLVDDITNTLNDPANAALKAAYQAAHPFNGNGDRLRLRWPALPGRPFRHRDGVPAPGVRGVRSQADAGHPAVPRLLPGHEPGHRGRVRPRGLPLRPLDARRRRRAHQHQGRRYEGRQQPPAAHGVPEPAGVLRQQGGLHAHGLHP